jgi:excisionase family DNA binding protein
MATMTGDEIPQMMSVKSFAKRLDVTEWTVRTWIRQGRIPHIKFGRRVLIRIDDVQGLLNAVYKPSSRAIKSF